MEAIYIKRVKNGFVVDIGGFGDEEETYLYKTREELKAALSGLVDRAQVLKAEYDAKSVEKK